MLKEKISIAKIEKVTKLKEEELRKIQEQMTNS